MPALSQPQLSRTAASPADAIGGAGLPLPVTAPPPFVFAAHQPLPLRGLTILAAEDSRYSADALRLMCQKSGARFRRAEDLTAAMAHLRLYRPDIMLIDLGLPDGRGEDLIAMMQSDALPQRPVLIALSAEPAGRAVALAAGADDFMEKPFPDLAAFQHMLLRHLEDGPARPQPFSSAIQGDPLALREDLERAEAALRNPGSGATGWLRGFLTGLAAQSADPDLARLAKGLGSARSAPPFHGEAADCEAAPAGPSAGLRLKIIAQTDNWRAGAEPGAAPDLPGRAPPSQSPLPD